MDNSEGRDGSRLPRADRHEDGCAIARVLVVVPVRDEERLLPACLTVLARAAARVDVPVRVQLVLDACTDAQRVADLTVDLCQSHAERDLADLGRDYAEKEFSWLPSR
ncbi:hypothetical protein ACLMAJ_12065 [Nocardia sp. KC 131]|uniref:hypothetical protein n=1 Tax=Nocardia arseniciresistens TaxID=3392119 RepID=UPI00398F5888